MHRVMAYFTGLMPAPMLRWVGESESRKIMEEEQLRVV